MVNILGFFSDVGFDFVSGIYGTVIEIYSLMIDIAGNPGNYIKNYTSLFNADIYVLVAVFMIFRVIISMIQMILNPDQVSDKNAGAGKMIVRIVTSVVFLLLFQPNGLLFGDSGLFTRVERALLANDSVLYKIVPKPSQEIALNETAQDEHATSIMFENVYADDVWEKTCYYYRAMYTTKERVENEDRDKGESKYTTKNVLHEPSYVKITFSNSSEKGGKLINGREKDAPIYFKIENTKEEGINFTDLGINTMSQNTWDFNAKGYKQVGDCSYWKINVHSPGSTLVYSKGKAKSEQLMGYNSIEKMIGASKLDYEEHATQVEKNGWTIPKAVQEYDGEVGADETALAFARLAAGSFERCSGEGQDFETCENARKYQFGKDEEGNSGNELAKKAIDVGSMELDFLMAIIAAVLLIGFVAIMCIDVIIREFKLLLLEMIAPIPIICYADPKDKVFGQWFKMYMNTYLDLFIKIIAINFAIALIGSMLIESSGLVTFFIIIAILVFAKTIPSMISKIFGLELGGSFKDILGMAKAGAGLAAGAAIGGAVGLATGQGIGRVTGALGGALRGAGSGFKGNVTGGAKSISAANARINQQKADGLSFMDRALIGAAAMTGYSPKTNLDNQIKAKVDNKKMLDDFRKHKDNIENMADSSNYMSDLKVRMQNGEIGKEDYKDARGKFIQLNENNRKNDKGNIEWYNASREEWVDSGQSSNYLDANGVVTSIKYEGSAKGKIEQAEIEMKAEFDSNSSLRKELGMEGQKINNFKSYEAAESIAKDKSNQYSKEIIEVQKSDEYGRASAFDEYSKGGK